MSDAAADCVDWVITGHPTPAELAAVVSAVVGAAAAATESSRSDSGRQRARAGGWGDPRHGHRRPPAPGRDAWRAALSR